jgi:molybdopterin-guanine dinucleotide biosynthesis protein A
MVADTGATVGLILAGGQSTRMGRDKALAPFAGAPLIASVIERLEPQVDTIAISANGDGGRFAGFDLPVLADLPAHAKAGPLAGVLAGLSWAQDIGARYMAVVPCDAPFLPDDLVRRLRAAVVDTGAVAMAENETGQLEPAFGLWPVAALARLVAVAESGEWSLRGAAARIGPRVAVAFAHSPGRPGSFQNINRPEELIAAEARLARRAPAGD